MLYHNNPALSELYKRILTQNKKVPVVLAQGATGTGRNAYYLEFIKALNCETARDSFLTYSPYTFTQGCSCGGCTQVSRREGHIDVLSVQSKIGIQELKESVFEIVRHRPVVLKHRYILIRNIDKYDKSSLDTLLKVLEDTPDYLICMLSTVSLSIPGAIKSRCWVYPNSLVGNEALKEVVRSTQGARSGIVLDGLQSFAIDDSVKDLGVCSAKFQFGSTLCVDAFVYLGVRLQVEDLLFKVSDPVAMSNKVKGLLKELKGYTSDSWVECLEGIMRYVLEVLVTYYTRQVQNKVYPVLVLESLIKILNRYNSHGCLFQSLGSATHYRVIDIERQVLSFFMSILFFRKIMRL